MVRLTRRIVPVLALLLAGWMPPAQADVTRIEITRRDTFPGPGFGAAGAYERLTGRFHGELDPAHALNAGIVDLARAPRNARGRVEYVADLDLLKPVDLARGNGALLYDVNNRGNKRVLVDFNDAPAGNDPTTLEHLGNGFLMRQGFTVVWSGWNAGLPSTNQAMRIDPPQAEGLEQPVWDELLANDRRTARWALSFPAASTDKSRARLTMRYRNGDAPVEIDAAGWTFVDARTIALADGRPFEMGVLYQFTYPAANPPVSGIGFAATRDLLSFLRHAQGEGNPLAGGIRRVLGYGASQSGRYLRDFTWRGFNEDEAGRQVFDAINPHISAARLFLDHRFAQPSRMTTLGYGFEGYPDTRFPFGYHETRDPLSGTEGSLLTRCLARGNCPRVIHTTTGTEYWQSGASLVTTDPQSRRDAPLPASVRVYHLAGTQHIPGATMPPAVCALPPNPVDVRPVQRALLLAMDRWVATGTEPPASRYPRIDQGTLVPFAQWRFPAIPGVQRPVGPSAKIRFDYGPRFDQGLFDVVPPRRLAGDYPVRVPQVDRDGNEIAGVRLPEQAVPLATTTGWAVRGAGSGTPGELCYLDGSQVPFLRHADQRRDMGDPRPSLAERYGTPAAWRTRLEAAARALVKDGLMVEEDVERLMRRFAAVNW
jgi:hypothetical protein